MVTSPRSPSAPATAPAQYHCAAGYGATLLRQLGCKPEVTLDSDAGRHPAAAWARCGLMAIVGDDGNGASLCPVPLPDCADGALRAFRALSETPVLAGIDGASLLTERAAITGYTANGDTSLQGHCRLLASADGHIAINLARADDWELLPALTGLNRPFDWLSLAPVLADMTTAQILEQGQLLGLAVVDATTLPTTVHPWFAIAHRGTPRTGTTGPAPRVVDLSSLWAGPLCSHLWQQAGAEVIKVESSQRPDGGRRGSPAFFRLLNVGKQQRQLDLRSDSGRRALRALIADADIVIEASRPRALRQMGLVAEDIIDSQPGLTWLSITGYGRDEPAANRVAYGDDAGIAAGLSAILHNVTGRWLVCGDAIADPLTGLHGALAGWASWRSGGGQLIDLPLSAVVRHCITATAPDHGDYRHRYREWQQYLQQRHIVPAPPARRPSP